MDVWIARAGVEIGAFRRKDLEDLARSGEIEPTDHYFCEGMEDWDLLENLLGVETWNPPELPPPPATASNLRFYLLGGVCLVFLVAAAGASLFYLREARSRTAQENEATAIRIEHQDQQTRNNRLRDQAAAELRTKIEKLPNKPSAASNVFYYGFWVTMRSTSSPFSPWLVTVRGGEDVVDPETQATVWRSDFTLETDYRNREWTFKHYRATTTNMKDGTTTQVDTDEVNGTPPMVVNNIGLKIAGPQGSPPPTVKLEAR